MLPLDLIGQKFNRLTVKEKIIGGDGKGHTKWLCECDCGGIAKVVGSHLKSGHTKSCGCSFYDINKKEYQKSAINRLIHRYKQSAACKNLVYLLDDEIFRELTSSNCFYCGCEPSKMTTFKNSNGNYLYNGIDRVDNNRGYEIDNVVPCCTLCNIMKKAMPQEEFINHIIKISKNLTNPKEWSKL